ncbi:hypothetical protein [Microbacterium rhizomatis]|uniref:DUF3558 domain-containing protein n=1 Tax=Microbacterium rhizomatis TaxID=1631477 RepID=A0A5J5IZZ0_9MICO|nr:hypothetical protein [Microbacterium rhizomatis]KAA9107856.1 hypothetical protein F6B43_10505 [Microbacterium rhizomatis]
MTLRRAAATALTACACLLLLTLTACAPEPVPAPSGSADARQTATATASPHASSSAAPTVPGPTGSATPGVYAIPADCRGMVNSSIIAQFGTTPLNDPAFAPTGVQPDGSIICVWGDPRADTTRLITKITGISRGPALDMLNQLADTQGFTCFTPNGGTRCEKTWQNTKYPVTDGRTLFWRDDILIDTMFSNLAPTGYTDSIVQSIFG